MSLNIDHVFKIGGRVLSYPEHFGAVLTAIAEESGRSRTLIVPGGGPFADAVRDVDRRLSLSDEAAHWMAVLAMDQYAYVLMSKLASAVIVTGPSEIEAALEEKRVPVLAPSRWLQAADPLPHSWDVTSDSIAAWVAGQVGARTLILIKPPIQGTPIPPSQLVDPYFARALPAHVSPAIVYADRLDSFEGSVRFD